MKLAATGTKPGWITEEVEDTRGEGVAVAVRPGTIVTAGAAAEMELEGAG
jgi:hypothetical protein